MALALAGDSVLAANVADRLASHTPPDGFANKVWLPEIRAAIELKRGKPMQAVEFLAPVTPYEAGWGDDFLAAYLRGEAYLAAHQGGEATVEFQKILDHRGIVLNSPTSSKDISRAMTTEDHLPREPICLNLPDKERIADFRLPIAPPWRADRHWKELPHHFFNRQSAISNRQS